MDAPGRREAQGRAEEDAEGAGAVRDPALTRDEEVDAGLAVLDKQSRVLHAIALDMCDEIAETTVRLHEHARWVDAQTDALSAHTDYAVVWPDLYNSFV